MAQGTLTKDTTTSEVVQRTITKQAATAELHRQSQKKIESLDDKTQTVLERYLNMVDEREVLQASNKHFERLVLRQATEIRHIQSQIEELAETRRAIIPLVMRMNSVIQQFVSLDIPFLPTERSQRSKVLHELVENDENSVADQFRRILQAYQIEVDYGRTIDAYETQISFEGSLLSVQILRIGRIGLYYLSQDEKQVGHWDHRAKQWTALDASHRRTIKDAIAVARKQLPPQLLELPFIHQ